MDYKELLNFIPENEGILVADMDYKPVFGTGIAQDFVQDGKICDLIPSLIRQSLNNGWVEFISDGCILHLKVQQLSSSYVMWIKDETKADHDRKMLAYCLEILDHINEGVIMTDEDSRIIIYNKKLGEFEDLNPEDVIGHRLKDVYDKWSAESSEHYQVLKTGQTIKESQYRNITKHGRTNYLVASSFPVKTGDKTEAAYSISRNVNTIQELYDRTWELQAAVQGDSNKLGNGTRFTFKDIIHKSASMQKLLADAEKAAWSDFAILVCGETGAGKELLVQSIHNAGPHRNKPFVALNCAALPENLLEGLLFGTKKGAFTGSEDMIGFFDQAGEGTLYLDEINSMPQNLQAKLLRAIQEKEFRRIGDSEVRTIKCKIISSVNTDPMICVKNGQLRQDLYYRLSTIVLEIPPLRQRKEDVEALVDYFWHKYSQLHGAGNLVMDEELKQAMQNYDWPGNVRELEHLIQRGISLMDTNNKMTVYSMPSYFREKLYSTKYLPGKDDGTLTLNDILLAAEKNVIKDALQQNELNISKTARALGIKRQNLQYRIEKLGLRELFWNK